MASYDLRSLASSLTVLLTVVAITGLIGIVFRPVLVVTVLCTVPGIIVFLTWLYRARQNAGQLDEPQRRSPGWSIGAWFVPVVFLWLPYQIMVGIWRAGLPAPERPKFAVRPAAWWACWCLAWFTGYQRRELTGLVFGGTPVSLAFAALAAFLLASIVRTVSDGPVGNLAVVQPGAWQPAASGPTPQP